MAKYILIMSSGIVGLSETIANVECVISVPTSAGLVADDEVLVYIESPINQIKMSLKVQQDQANDKVQVAKIFETANGLEYDDLSDSVKTKISNAVTNGNTIIPLTETEFDDIYEKLKSLIIPAQSSSSVSASQNVTSANDLYSDVTSEDLDLPYNYIFYGAPGTGKSNTCERLRKEHFPDTYERVTFYDRYSYAAFVGAYKPITATSGEVQYEFSPGPFTRLLVKALRNKDKNYVLIIEEINRARAASVFGDVFQLLDRADGVSEYPIATSEDMRKYLAKAYYGEDYVKDNADQLKTFEYLKIPKNMYIWATMNSMDQGVTALDTAFKRRWEFKYIGVNDPDTLQALEDGDYKIPMLTAADKRYFVTWNDLRKAINKRLLEMPGRMPEDKLMGPFFISGDLLKSVKLNLDKYVKNDSTDIDINMANKKMDDFIHSFESKVLMYLFDDAAKSKPDEIFRNYSGDLILSELFNAFESSGESIFDISIKHYTYDPDSGEFVEKV